MGVEKVTASARAGKSRRLSLSHMHTQIGVEKVTASARAGESRKCVVLFTSAHAGGGGGLLAGCFSSQVNELV